MIKFLKKYIFMRRLGIHHPFRAEMDKHFMQIN